MTKCKCCGQELPKEKEIKWLRIGDTEWSENLGEMTWDEAVAKCQELGGYLPGKSELLDLYDNHKKELAELEKLDSAGGYGFWSSTEDYTATANAWYVFLYIGSTYSGTKTYSYYVRCIRKTNEK